MVNIQNPNDFLEFLVDAYKTLSDDFKIEAGLKSPRPRKMTPVKVPTKKGANIPPQSARETKVQDQVNKENKMANQLKFKRFEKLLQTHIIEKEATGQILFLMVNPDKFE